MPLAQDQTPYFVICFNIHFAAALLEGYEKKECITYIEELVNKQVGLTVYPCCVSMLIAALSFWL